ncbi:protein GRAVITROPIC IN THE LIGHT 1-like [Phoenix dactylifera]|uniref:Protein GRAVITROPIC IN THE LIGHT 1-like n=1 Tax=Phoenix dactylifera TaxID=42345 RepID=A0A8B7BGD8_PHODC|nr:protein GRAVITROPIC IN THE LIGHT 1-like [Phoenix dactylifera]
MDPATASPSMMARSFAKILRLRRASTISGHEGMESSKDDRTHKLKFSKSLEGYSSVLSEPHCGSKGKEEEQQQQKLSNDREIMESLLANLFARISSIKAAYAQLQFAQSPYDPDSIQSADQAVVSELRNLSELKHYYINNQFDIHTLIDSKAPLEAQVQEQRNLLKTYKITTRKLESDLDFKDSKILSLQAELLELDNQNKSLKAMLQPGRCSLSSLDDLHLSGLNPNHLLVVLRYAVKSIRSFVKLMVQEMESARWDLDAAAGVIHPDVVLWKPEHRIFAFESYICQKMFSDFHHRDFNLSLLKDCANWNQQQFFDEFVKLKSSKTRQVLDGKVAAASGLWNFCRAKYLSLVHQTMEVAFFGSLNYRSLVSSGRGFPDSEFFLVFAEMARRVWLLHCLFFSFGTEMEASIFQVRRGCWLSEAYMENVVVADDGAGVRPAVGFTVVPGFKLGKVVIQSKVYPLLGEPNGRS